MDQEAPEEERDRLKKAVDEFIEAIAQALGIYKLLDQLSDKLNRKNR